jgi:hypothetical protein
LTNCSISNQEDDRPTITVTCANVHLSSLIIQHDQFDDDNICAVKIIGQNSYASLNKCFITSTRDGVHVEDGAEIEILDSIIHDSYNGLVLNKHAHATIQVCQIVNNKHGAILLESSAVIELYNSLITGNGIGIIVPTTLFDTQGQNDRIIMIHNNIVRNGKNFDGALLAQQLVNSPDSFDAHEDGIINYVQVCTPTLSCKFDEDLFDRDTNSLSSDEENSLFEKFKS